MAILTFKVDEDNVTEFQYEQALKVITLYIEAQDKEVKELELFIEQTNEVKQEIIVKQVSKEKPKKVNRTQLIIDKAKAVNEYQKVHFIPSNEIELKVKPKKVKYELDANGKRTHFNLFLSFSQQFVEILESYFLTYHKAELNPIRVSRSELSNMNIFKFNRLTNFKSHHVIKLVKFLNENDISCTHELDRHNKLIAKIMK